MSQMKWGGRVVAGAMLLAAILARPEAASAQLDPLLMIKKGTPANPVKPNVIFAVETSARMQYDADGTYYDPNDYVRGGLLLYPWEWSLNVDAPTARYRRKYINLQHANGGSDKMNADRIDTVGDDQASAYANFFSKTRLLVARTALAKALTDNTSVTRFGLIKMRQNTPTWGTAKNIDPVNVADANQTLSELGTASKWAVTRTTVNGKSGSLTGITAPLVLTDAVNSNTSVASYLSAGVNVAGGLIPASDDSANDVDVPIEFMLDDAKAEATRLIAADGTNCRNTIVVLVVGGGQGNTVVGANPATKASQFLAISSRRVPIYVIAIAPQASEVAQLTAIATNSGGQYFEITKAMIDGAPAGTPVPELVRAANIAISHGFMDYVDCNKVPAAPLPYGPQTEFQVTSPVVGTVNLKGLTDINGTGLPDSETDISHPVSGAAIPQRSNVMITTAFALPNFEGKLRAVRVYKPVVDATKPTGYKFQQDGTKLWVASTPAAASRNIFTVTQNGTMTALTTANVATLAPYMNVSVAEATRIITYVRSQPLGPFVGSTPAFMDPPSIDPPPDADYPGFIDDHKDRRTLIWVGGNDGMMHAIDGRTGVEVYAFVPFNLLAKLKALPDGNAIGSPDYFVDSSPKLADVRIGTAVASCPGSAVTCWRTYLFFGEGPGGTFYQALDVTLEGIASSVAPLTGTTTELLAYFADATRVKFRWSFPHYNDFDYTLAPYGDIKSTASNAAKSVGETWSDPAVGQIQNSSGKYALLTGSGFFPASTQGNANRGNVAAGTTFYLINIDDGTLFDSEDVGNDNQGESTDNCATAATPDCTRIKNAIQADVVATGPPDSRYITKAYVGDLDGNVWRFDFAMVSGVPSITAKTNLYAAGRAHPLFASMATVNVGATQQYIFFGTGSDLLPSAGIPSTHSYKLLSVLDSGSSGTVKYTNTLQSINLTAPDEKVTGFPAVAGDIVFFVTTLTKPNLPCNLPDATLYATTFTGGLGYTAQAGAQGTGAILTVTGARATAPFIVDQHVAFGFGSKVEMLGDANDYNNGVGQVGVRILSWRDVR
jgi:Neisseria PilC beta-propeller domain